MSDLISRQAAIDALGKRPVVWTDKIYYILGARNQYAKDRLAIETVPSAQRWIPCSERLPDSCGWYICSIKDGRVNALYYANRLGWIDNVRKYMFELYDIRSKLTGTEVTPDQEAVDWNDWVMAWMPLPTPYRE